MTEEEKTRPIVALKKITYPGGERLTRSLVRFDIESHSYNPDGDVINQLLPRIDHEYEVLMEKSRAGDVTDAVDEFFRSTSEIAVVGDGLREALASDLGKETTDIDKTLLGTKWFKSVLEYLKTEFRRTIKKDPVKYAESARQLVDVFGRSKSIYLLNTNGIKLKRSALAALCRIANETPKIKALIRDGKLKLTIAFELPNIGEQERERIAEQITSFKTYDEQKDFLKKAKECQRYS